MSLEKIIPYLHFNGDAAQAIRLYERVLGAKVHMLSRYGDMPGTPADSADRVIHAELRVGDVPLMLSDAPADFRVQFGSNMQVSLHYTDPDEMRRVFDGLAAGGQVVEPIVATPWGADFGMLVDPFGVRWMFNCEKQKS